MCGKIYLNTVKAGVGALKSGEFRKRPVVVHAFQTDKPLIIETLEGPLKAEPGDWIITGVAGEQYPCKPAIFEKTYEAVKN